MTLASSSQELEPGTKEGGAHELVPTGTAVDVLPVGTSFPFTTANSPRWKAGMKYSNATFAREEADIPVAALMVRIRLAKSPASLKPMSSLLGLLMGCIVIPCYPNVNDFYYFLFTLTWNHCKTPMMSKETRVNVRVSDDLKKRLKSVTDETKISETSFVIACLEAVCDHFEEHGEITMPLVVKPKSAESANKQPKRKAA